MKHAEAIEDAITDRRLSTAPQFAPLLELCRTLAAQMDTAGAEPSTRLTAAYLSALKDLRKAALEVPVRVEANALTRLRRLRDMPAPTKKTRRPA
jgi:hypothetical protein